MKALLFILILPFNLFAAREIIIKPFKTTVHIDNAKVIPDKPSTLSIECILNKEKKRYNPHLLNWKQTQDGLYEVEFPERLTITSGTNSISPSKCYAIINFWSRDELINLGEIGFKEIRVPLGRLGKSAGEFLEEILSSSQINLFTRPFKGSVKTEPKICL